MAPSIRLAVSRCWSACAPADPPANWMLGSAVPPRRTMIFDGGQFVGALEVGALPVDAVPPVAGGVLLLGVLLVGSEAAGAELAGVAGAVTQLTLTTFFLC